MMFAALPTAPASSRGNLVLDKSVVTPCVLTPATAPTMSGVMIWHGITTESPWRYAMPS
jgi:hypothetical protein